MKRILYLSFYFEPDLCAGSFRNTPLAKELANAVGDEGEVHVITTYPNRYHSFKQDALLFETQDNLLIHRIKIPSHKSGIIDQARSFVTFFIGTFKISRKNKYDLVFASSSRLFTAFLGKLLSVLKHVPLYLDIRDIFVDTINDVIHNKIFRFLGLPFLRLIEHFTFSKAVHINLISQGFESYFKRYTKPGYSFFTNGIDPDFIRDKQQIGNSDNQFKNIVYAGNIGAGQGLQNIIPQLVKTLFPDYRFTIIGDGGNRIILEYELKKNGLLDLVSFIPPMKRDDLIKIYESADFLFLHLNKYPAFEKVLPSKLFDYAAYDVPILAGVDGYARSFIQKNIPNSIVFEPNNPEELITKLSNYNYQRIHRNHFINSFSREKINKQMAKSILQYAGM